MIVVDLTEREARALLHIAEWTQVVFQSTLESEFANEQNNLDTAKQKLETALRIEGLAL
jgi:hypothetical protein